MNTAAVQILTGAAGAAAFALYVHMRPKLLPAAAFGSVLGWGVYLLIYHFHPHLFFCNMLAAVVVYVWCKILARLLKMPVTTFLVPGIFPLLPGGYLYYTMLALLNRQAELFRSNAVCTIATTLGIACGVVAAAIVANTILDTAERLRKRNGSRRQI